MGTFVKEHDFETRVAESTRVRSKFPDRIPVICEKDARSDVPSIDKKKYLVPADLTVGQFVYVVRKRIKLAPEKAIFVFINNFLPPTSSLMSAIYDTHKAKDGFLYITYSGENTFGCSTCTTTCGGADHHDGAVDLCIDSSIDSSAAAGADLGDGVSRDVSVPGAVPTSTLGGAGVTCTCTSAMITAASAVHVATRSPAAPQALA